MKVKVLIVDDHAIVRKGLRNILADADFEVEADEAEDGRTAIEMAGREDYDVIVLDISLPDKNGLEVLKELKLQKPLVRCLMLTMHPEEQYAVRVLRAGAAGYLTKESAPDQLVEAIRAVSQGRRYITPSVAERLADELGATRDDPPHKALSDREYEVMLLIASGNSIADIAKKLCLSPKTIATYKYRILEKTGLGGVMELTRYAIKNGLVD